jgi:hypothetical protein
MDNKLASLGDTAHLVDGGVIVSDPSKVLNGQEIRLDTNFDLYIML